MIFTRLSTRPSTCLAIILVLCVAASGAFARENDYRRGNLRALTQNLYIGTDITKIIGVSDPAEIPLRVAEALQTVADNRFDERADALARIIRRTNPDVIGLQEVSWLRTQTPGDFFLGNPVAADDELYDYLTLLMDSLAARGLHYKIAGVVTNSDVELPAFAGFDANGFPQFIDVRLTDRDVILVRKPVKVFNNQSGHYQVSLEIPMDGFSIEIKRGYASADVRVRGNRYRIVNTHLEDKLPIALVQSLQASELIGLFERQTLPLVLLGDFNSDPRDFPPAPGIETPYTQLTQAGFEDIWRQRRHRFRGPGFTCCQTETLDNPHSMLDQRIDQIFVRSTDGYAMLKKVRAKTVGDRPRDKTPGGLWPSDHAGVYGRLLMHLPVPRGY